MRFLRRWLGLDADMEFLTKKLNYQFGELHQELMTMQVSVGQLRRSVEVSQQGLGRIVAKLDPMYGRSEMPPTAAAGMSQEEAQQAQDNWMKRKAESDQLGQEAINRLYAERDAAQSRYSSGSQGTS